MESKEAFKNHRKFIRSKIESVIKENSEIEDDKCKIISKALEISIYNNIVTNNVTNWSDPKFINRYIRRSILIYTNLKLEKNKTFLPDILSKKIKIESVERLTPYTINKETIF